jgi:biopolymer transport protein ExbB
MPLLGVLGTLLALVSFYEQPGVTDGAAAAPVVAATLQQALLLSSAGIALAIPTYLFYMYLASRARKLINQVERAGLECVHIIADARDDAQLRNEQVVKPIADTGSPVQVDEPVKAEA